MGFLVRQFPNFTNYELYAYLTEDGKNAFYNGGFNSNATYFSLGSNDINYNYSGTTDEYTVTLRGTIQEDEESDANLGIDYDTIENKIVQYPDIQLSESLNLITFTIDDNGNKLFNNSFMNHPYSPINLINSNFSFSGQTGDDNLGVSVTDGNYNNTDYSKFYLLNKSAQSVYLDNIQLIDVDPFSNFLIDQRTIIPDTGDTAFVEYDIGFFSDLKPQSNFNNAYYDGRLTLKFNKLFFKFNERLSLFPFQIFPFEVKYEVIAPGSHRFHYHGQTFNDNNTGGFGKLNFTFQFTAIDKKRRIGNFQEIKQNVGVICEVYDTGYNSSTYEKPQPIYQ